MSDPDSVPGTVLANSMPHSLAADVVAALADDRVVDITTVGRRSGRPRRVEIWMFELGGSLYISGTPGPRGWYANLMATPEFTLHLKKSVRVDLAARARPITEPGERRCVLEQIGGELGEAEELIAGSPLVEVELLARRSRASA